MPLDAAEASKQLNDPYNYLVSEERPEWFTIMFPTARFTVGNWLQLLAKRQKLQLTDISETDNTLTISAKGIEDNKIYTVTVDRDMTFEYNPPNGNKWKNAEYNTEGSSLKDLLELYVTETGGRRRKARKTRKSKSRSIRRKSRKVNRS